MTVILLQWLRFVIVIRVISALPSAFPTEDTENTRETIEWAGSSGNQEWNASVSLATDKSKSSHNTEEGGIFSTRHAKHRRRGRCKNRATCAHGIIELGKTSVEIEEEQISEDRNFQDEETEVGYNFMLSEDAQNQRYAKEAGISMNEYNPGSLYKFEKVQSYSELIGFGEKISPSWGSLSDNKGENPKYSIDAASSSSYGAAQHQNVYYESLSALLIRLFQSLRNVSITEQDPDIFKELNFVANTNQDPCQKWLDSKDKLDKVFSGTIALLPACPCEYPSNIFYDDKIWDKKQRKHFRWRDVSSNSQRLDVYKPGAAYCVRSLLTQGSENAAAQHCCYDRKRKLLTRGSGAGTPNFVSPEMSPALHERIDVLPWRLCKGDFSRYNHVRPPNNDNDCESNPDDEEYQRQIDDTKYY